MPETRSFEERKAPLRALAHADLLARLDHHEQRMRAVITDVLAGEPDAVIPWTGRQMAVAKFTPHLRNEHAGTAGTSQATTRPALRCWPRRI